MQSSTRIIAIVGGSGSDKTWLANHLNQKLAGQIARLSLDDFYQDHSHLSPTARDGINFDHPAAVDWPLVRQTLNDCRSGRPVEVPRYNFATHTRLPRGETISPAPLVVIDGLWLLWWSTIRVLFDLKIFLDCPMQFRLERRLARDVSERGRTPESVRSQFWKTVAPMHRRFVEPQSRWADLVLQQPPGKMDLSRLVSRLQSLIRESDSTAEAITCPPRTGAGCLPAAALPTP